MAGKSLRPCLAGLPLASALLKEPELFWAPSSFLEERETAPGCAKQSLYRDHEITNSTVAHKQPFVHKINTRMPIVVLIFIVLLKKI